MQQSMNEKYLQLIEIQVDIISDPGLNEYDAWFRGHKTIPSYRTACHLAAMTLINLYLLEKRALYFIGCLSIDRGWVCRKKYWVDV